MNMYIAKKTQRVMGDFNELRCRHEYFIKKAPMGAEVPAPVSSLEKAGSHNYKHYGKHE